MPPVRPTMPTSLPHLRIMVTDDGSYTLSDVRLDETYHSGCGALSECLHVYLRNSQVQSKLAASWAGPVRVLELGFGTGMGWLLTAVAADALGGSLEYISYEKSLLPVDVLQQVDAAGAIDRAVAGGWLPAGYTSAGRFQAALLKALAGRDSQAQCLVELNQNNRLKLLTADACISQFDQHRGLDAIYFDAFSPGTNPELWQVAMFQKMSGSLKPDGLLVSYCVSGAVRRALAEAGYQVTRHPGPPGGKREVLVARVGTGLERA